MIKNLAVLGSTGSVGQSTLEVIRQNKDKFNINKIYLSLLTNCLIENNRCL